MVEADDDQDWPSISPEGRFVAFGLSDERGNESVLVRDLNDGTTTSVAQGGAEPRWSRDGSYLFYKSYRLGTIYRIGFDATTKTADGEAVKMFFNPRIPHMHWDVSPEEDTILLSAPGRESEGGSQWKVVLNWAGTLGA